MTRRLIYRLPSPNEQNSSFNKPSDLPAEPADASAVPAEPAEVAFGTLDELWAKILAALAPRGTQMLMSQQGVLMSFDGVGATVGFRSPTLHKMARERVPNLEAAFEAIFQRPIKVSLEVLNAEDSDEKKPDPDQAPPTNQSRPAPPIKDSKPSAAPRQSSDRLTPPSPPTEQSSTGQSSKEQFAKEPSAKKPSSNEQFAENPAENGSTKGRAPNTPFEAPLKKSPPSSPPQNPTLPSAGLPTNSDQWAVNQDQDSIKRFAQFFNGQIVDLDNIDDFSDPSDDQKSKKKKSSDPGPDVPF